MQDEQRAIISTLTAGDVITLNSDQLPVMLSPKNWPKDNIAFAPFQRLAQATGGIMGHASSPELLNPLFRKMTAHILKDSEGNESLDIAFVLDTTSSMEPYIAQVQKHLTEFLEQLQKKVVLNGENCHAAILEYRDQGEDFLNFVDADFTTDFTRLQSIVKTISTSGGGDIPEAVLDALLAAKNQLSWSFKAKRVVILISDAPPHPKTQDKRYEEMDEEKIIGQLSKCWNQNYRLSDFIWKQEKLIMDK